MKNSKPERLLLFLCQTKYRPKIFPPSSELLPPLHPQKSTRSRRVNGSATQRTPSHEPLYISELRMMPGHDRTSRAHKNGTLPSPQPPYTLKNHHTPAWDEPPPPCRETQIR